MKLNLWNKEVRSMAKFKIVIHYEEEIEAPQSTASVFISDNLNVEEIK